MTTCRSKRITGVVRDSFPRDERLKAYVHTSMPSRGTEAPCPAPPPKYCISVLRLRSLVALFEDRNEELPGQP